MSATSLSLEWFPESFEDPRELYKSMRTKALLGRLFSILTGHSRSLLDLTMEVSRRKIRNQYDAGYRTVSIQRIKGSEGRAGDFDCDFNPIHKRSMDRWVSVAEARSKDAALPAVELIQLDGDYFVRDGHHRISVARAFRQEYIDAKVIILKLEPTYSHIKR